jgi:hypothetical protein
MTEGQGRFFCVSWAWRKRGGWRVVHLHWPKSGITSCERAVQARRTAEERP